MNKNRARRKIVSTAILSAIICTQAATAAETTDFETLYQEKNYSELCKRFEAHKTKSWRDADSAYYYAIALLALGKTDEGLVVCKTIEKRYPKTDAAILATSAIRLWTSKSIPDAETRFESSSQTSRTELIRHQSALHHRFGNELTTVNDQTGVVGLKFCICSGQQPTICRVFSKTPAQQADLRSGDVIASVGEVPARGLTKEQLFKLIIGPPNSTLTMTVIRDGVPLRKQLRRIASEQLKINSPEAYREYLTTR